MGLRANPVDPVDLPPDAIVRHYDQLDEDVQFALAALKDGPGCVSGAADVPEYVKFTRYYRFDECSSA